MNAANEFVRKDYLTQVARMALPRWNIAQDAQLHLLSLSENAMFLVSCDHRRWVLRVHRQGYHSLAAVRSELAWMRALRDDAGIETPIAVSGTDRQLVQQVMLEPETTPRMLVLFDFIPGSAPEPDNLLDAFGQLGSITARMHRHSRQWQRPAFFQRQVWDYQGAFGDAPIWGHWRAGFSPHAPGLEILEQAEHLMCQHLERYGKAPDRFGLIHTDFRLSNLLVDQGRARVLDFDDSGFGWYLYDLASSVTFLENHPDIGKIIAAWIDGYRQVQTLGEEHLALIPTLMMFRTLVVLGWAGSHPCTDLALEMHGRYSASAVEFASRYLAGRALRGI
ncbi:MULTISPECIES: phosphotransferase enzyme family protein [Pseudomonas]|uniref:Phosphotransferase n=2 Tax=Pseudomonas TaxID=286 RepID=A0ABY9NP39_9PSED|nr:MULTISPECIES: phosphotransferase [Pseudomonas]WMN20085.1 phosphotransferase [Pseudomonas piscis]